MEGIKEGFVIWITGLAGSGKSTISTALCAKIREQMPIVQIDGDSIRDLLQIYDYNKKGRIEIAKKYADFANFLSIQGISSIISTISLFDEVYAYNRSILKHYFEVYIQCDLQELKARDQKGLYSQALAGNIKDVVGLDIAFDEPKAHLVLSNNTRDKLQSNIEIIFKQIAIKFKGYL